MKRSHQGPHRLLRIAWGSVLILAVAAAAGAAQGTWSVEVRAGSSR